ncbi:MAG: hypothetical protein IK134_06225 [Oscillospiraceae bacterium]|nr:hypothetical protein [Oscillospiraceae bacterium]
MLSIVIMPVILFSPFVFFIWSAVTLIQLCKLPKDAPEREPLRKRLIILLVLTAITAILDGLMIAWFAEGLRHM